MPLTILSDHGAVVLPTQYRTEDNLRPGETFEVERTKAGEYILRRKGEGRVGSTGLLDALLEFQKIAPGAVLTLPDRSLDEDHGFRNIFE